MTYKQYPVIGPFKGIWDRTPRPHTPRESFDDILNFFCRHGRVQTRPRLNNFAQGAPPDGAKVRVMVTFMDVEGLYHTLVLTQSNAYFLSEISGYTQLTYPAGMTTLGGGTLLPFGYTAMNNRIYFSNGTWPILYADGSAALQVASPLGGMGEPQGFPGAARFLTENAFHLIAAFTLEPIGPGQLYPARVRWSKSGDGNNWLDFTSGLNDLTEVVDEITGLVTLGRNTFVFRTNGATIMSPTGQGTSPFIFEHYSSTLTGLGNRFPYSLATYGNRACFVSADDIYVFDGLQAPVPIGANCKKKIFADLANATSRDEVVGFQIARLGINYDFSSYWLSIPGPNVTWVYAFDEGAWQRFTSSAGALSCLATVAVQ